MVRKTATALAATLAVAGAAAPALAQAQSLSPPPDVMRAAAGSGVASLAGEPRELIVRYEPGASARTRGLARDRAGVELISTMRLPRTQVVAVDGGSLDAAVARVERQPGVAYAVPNRIARARAMAPNDPGFVDLWGMGSVNALAAWDVTRGAGQVVAVVDSGVDLAHPDLAPNLWTNPGETPANGVDDDGNGFVDDVNGWDFAQPDRNGAIAEDADPDDYLDHGTHVAGTIAAVAGNGVGVAGVAPAARVMPVRVLDASGFGSWSAILSGILYAAEEGADVINLSLGGSPEDTNEIRLWTAVIDAAGQRGAVVIGAAGNDAIDVDAVGDLPCSATSANLVCVAALRDDGELDERYSNYGARHVDVGAPGTDVLSTVPPMEITFGDDFTDLSQWLTDPSWGTETIGSLRYLSDSPGGSYAPGAMTGALTNGPLMPADVFGCSLSYGARADFGVGDEGLIVTIDSDDVTVDGIRFTGSTPSGVTVPFYQSLEAWSGTALRLGAIVDANADAQTADGLRVARVRVYCRTADRSGPEYSLMTGTSMAAPHVSGVAALVRSAAPWATPDEVAAAVRAGTVPVASLAGRTVTGGRVDALRAIEAAPPRPVDPPVDPPVTPPVVPPVTPPVVPPVTPPVVPPVTPPVVPPVSPPVTTPAPPAPAPRPAPRARSAPSRSPCDRLAGKRKRTCVKHEKAKAICKRMPQQTKRQKAKRAACHKRADRLR